MARDKGGESGTLAILSSSKEMAFLPTTLHRLSGNSGHFVLPGGFQALHGVAQNEGGGSGKEDHKDDEEDNEDEEDFDHEPPIGGD